MVACDLCGEKFRNNSKLGYHRDSSCYECDLTWECDNEYKTHFNQLHIFKCDSCEFSFAKEGSLKSHIKVRYCDECDLTSKCYCDFIDHVEEHYESNPSLYFRILEANEDKHKKEVDGTSADEDQIDDVTPFKKPLIPTRPTEEIGTYSVLSKADHIDDLESPVDKTDKVAKISPRAEIEGHEEQCDKEENGSNLEGKNEEENSEERKRDDTEQRGVLDNLENAYEIGNVQRASKGIFCKKRGKTAKSKKKLRRHIKKGHQTVKKTTCNSCDDTPNRRTDSRIHGKKVHEHDNDNEEGKNDEARTEPNIGNIKKAKKNVSLTWIGNHYSPSLTKDENNIWKGRRRKLFKTSSTQIPMPTDNQKNRKKWVMPIGLKYQGYGASNNDVWTINSYYRISDERGKKKKKTARLYTILVFVYPHI